MIFGKDAILLVGNLKVGKTTIFSSLATHHVQQLTYPHTRVNLSCGKLVSQRFSRIIDAPGCYSLLDRSEDAYVLRDILVRKRVGGVLLVLDAKNLRRGFALALELAEMEMPVVVALNMADEARQRGIEVHIARLAEILGVPVTLTIARERNALQRLKHSIANARPLKISIDYPLSLVHYLKRLHKLFKECELSQRGLSYLVLAKATKMENLIEEYAEAPLQRQIREITNEISLSLSHSPRIILTEAAYTQAFHFVNNERIQTKTQTRLHWFDQWGAWTRRISTGIPIVIGITGVIYLFVGWFGAVVLVDLVEGKFFDKWLLPFLNNWVAHIPWALVREALMGQFGLITVGLVLPVGIVLPVLATFFLAFAALEDSGYLPRLSLLLDRVFKHIGLNGKGILPLAMGFSCVTMAVLTTRILDTRKQRIIATLLLVSTFPCAPLLSVMMVMLGRLSIWATLVVFGVILLQIILIGWVANLILPGASQDFILELQPLRLPRVNNMLARTGQQLVLFFKEAIPYFLVGTFVLFLLQQCGALQVIHKVAEPLLTRAMGLPSESADMFLLCLARREAGATLLVHQAAIGMYDGIQSVVVLLVATFIVPCINTLLVTFKEHGFIASFAIIVFSLLYAVFVGILVNFFCRALGVEF